MSGLEFYLNNINDTNYFYFYSFEKTINVLLVNPNKYKSFLFLFVKSKFLSKCCRPRR